MYQRLLIAILFIFLGLGMAAGQEEDAVFAPISSKSESNGSDRSINNLRLTGVLISSSSRTALVNGRPVQEGDVIGGAEILEIEQRGIRILVGARELAISVGSAVAVDAPGTRVAHRSSGQAREARAVVRATTSRHQGERGNEALAQHAVESGDTLSDIAMRYRTDGITMEQMMIALYEANPTAFKDNINVLRAGAVLRIPDAVALHRQAPALAAAEVARHAARWRSANQAPLQLADTSPARQYGAVERGETLSEIASRVLPDGVTLNQMMIAIYEANPQAFSNNINVLHEGTILRIPAQLDSGQLTPETATAEVVRHTKLWQTGQEEQALPDPPDANIMASIDMPLD